jgi:hypothetical protein
VVGYDQGTMTVRVSRRMRVAQDAAKAAAIAADGRAITFTGDARHLLNVRKLLAGHPVETFLGNDHDGTATLFVSPPGGVGWESDQV